MKGCTWDGQAWKWGVSLLSIHILLAGSHLQGCLSAREVGKCRPSACPTRRWDGSRQARSTVIFRLWEVYVEGQRACDLCSWMDLGLDTDWMTFGKESIFFSLCLAGKCGRLVGLLWELNGCKMSMSQYTFTLILNTTGMRRRGKEEKTDWVPVSYFVQPCVPELPSRAQLSPESRLHQMPRVVACSSVSY